MIDIPAAVARDITVCNTPGANDVAVAEHTFALLLGLLRQVPRCDAGMRGGKWEQGAILGREVQGRTFGIVGMGAIGRCVASIAQGFGGRVTGFDPYWPEAFAAERNIERRDLDTLLRESDFVCIHCPLTPQTENLIGTRELGLMKPSSVLVNMARGGIVDESALYDALPPHQRGRTRRLFAGAALIHALRRPAECAPFAACRRVHRRSPRKDEPHRRGSSFPVPRRRAPNAHEREIEDRRRKLEGEAAIRSSSPLQTPPLPLPRLSALSNLCSQVYL